MLKELLRAAPLMNEMRVKRRKEKIMGYYASGDGHIVITPPGDLEEFYQDIQRPRRDDAWIGEYKTAKEGLKTNGGVIDAITALLTIDFVDRLDKDSVEIQGYVELSKWYDDQYRKILDAIAPMCTGGEIRFTGEDDCHWRFRFYDGCWHEEAGEIVYEGDPSKTAWIVSRRYGNDLEEPIVCVGDEERARKLALEYVLDGLMEALAPEARQKLEKNYLDSNGTWDIEEVSLWAESEFGFTFYEYYFWDGSRDAYEATVTKHSL